MLHWSKRLMCLCIPATEKVETHIVYDGYTNTVNRSAISSSIIHPHLDTSNLLLQQSFYITNSDVKNKCSYLPIWGLKHELPLPPPPSTTTFHHHCGNPNWRRSTVGRTTRLAWKAFRAFDGHRFSVLPCWNLHLSVIAATPVRFFGEPPCFFRKQWCWKYIFDFKFLFGWSEETYFKKRLCFFACVSQFNLHQPICTSKSHGM